MPHPLNELALEDAIEKALTGTTFKEMAQMPETGPYHIGKGVDFNRYYAIDEKYFWQYLNDTQRDKLDELKKYYPHNYKEKILQRFDQKMRQKGIIHLLKHDLEIEHVAFQLKAPLPLESSPKQAYDAYEKNIFSITRQVKFEENTNNSIDSVLFLNGIPLLTLELKNAITGQTARFNGQEQYKNRDPAATLLNFGRTLTHMTVDTDEIWMTTKLAKEETVFLPFNKGYHHGAGNPPNPNGFKTSYLWEAVLQPKSLSNILENFVLIENSNHKKKQKLSDKRLIFPRYHQLNVVTNLCAHATDFGAGQKYLIQHSAGSGKSNSITWLAYKLIEVFNEKKTPLFKSVIVVTDRNLLDKQLRDNIKNFSEIEHIIGAAEHSRDLKKALESGKKIIITTIQKFPYIVDAITDLSNNNFAVIIDEAHSSQSGIASRKMNEAMNKAQDEDDNQDQIIHAMKRGKMAKNVSYFAFTATPKNITLEKFGTQQDDGSFLPFDLYSMKQAIEEAFILNVLNNYTTYQSFYKIQKSLDKYEEKLFRPTKATKKLKKYVERHPKTIATKAGLIVNEFITKIFKTKKLCGHAKAMIITQDIEAAINYYHAVVKHVHEQGNLFKVLIAFSGEKTIKGETYSESRLNGFSESETANKFNEDDYRILIVANKYLTGFDQPKLCAMYVDKRLQGVMAVQALSRLNRTANYLNKKSEDLFILDFYNKAEEIQKAFEPFFKVTSLEGPTDINVLNDILEELDAAALYKTSEIEKFCHLYFDNADVTQLTPILDSVAQRFNYDLDWPLSEKVDFKIKARQYIRIYGQVSSLLPYENKRWEEYFWFLKFLIPKLIVKEENKNELDDLLNAVNLETYALRRTRLAQNIALNEENTPLKPTPPTVRHAHDQEEKKESLEEIITHFNQQFHNQWPATPEEQKIKFIKIVHKIKNEKDFQEKVLNNKDHENSAHALRKIIDKTLHNARQDDMQLYRSLVQDKSFKESFYDMIFSLLE